MLETLDHTIRIGSTPTFLYFDLYIIHVLKYKKVGVLPIYKTKSNISSVGLCH